MKHKILIIKLGYTETLDNARQMETISLGDIFRTTALLHSYKNDKVTWLTSGEGVPLLSGNPFIDRILVYDLTSVLALSSEYFDVVINLEKIPGICAFADKINSWQRYGFRFDDRTGNAEAYVGSYEAIANSDNPKLRGRMKKHWIKMLYDMIGRKWQGESYILGYRPRTKVKFDIGFNYKVGKKWQNKAWSENNFRKLEGLIQGKYSYSYQESLNDIRGYIDWLNSCRLIVTNDSLGLHLAIALKKKVIALFGPSSDREIHLFSNGTIIKPEKKLKCMPCFLPECRQKTRCIDLITPEKVYKTIRKII